MPALSKIVAGLAALGAILPMAAGHTWIEQLRSVNDKGQYVGEYGYPRGMKAKTDPGYDGDAMNFELPAQQQKVFIDDTTPLCHPSQRKQEQSSDKYPRLKAAPGGFVAMRYMENGHVTLVDPATGLGKPENGGTVFVYGTTQPIEDERLVNVLHWTKDGQGGDKRGILLGTNDFDDGRCYEVNDTPTSQERRIKDPNFALGQASDGPGSYPLFCETDVKLPTNITTGKPYTLYWVWQWNTAPDVNPGLPDGRDQYYTTCIDIDVASPNGAFTKATDHKYALGQQDAMSVAPSGFASRTAIITDPVAGEVGPVFTGSASGAPTNSANATVPITTIATALPPTTMVTKPSPVPTEALPPGVIVVTDTVFVTVTAPAATAPPTTTTAAAPAYMVPRAAHSIRHINGAKFRGH